MNEIILIALVSIFFSFIYIQILYKFFLLKKNYNDIEIKNIFFERHINSIEENKIQDGESAHKENFIRFLSDSRDWAYEYIEEVQTGLENFISNVEPEINYFNEYGDIGSMAPNYYSMKKITEEYKKLKTLLPIEKEK